MARRAARLLARSWYRAHRRWWRASAATLALFLAAVVLVSGLFAGLQSATEERIADFYTDDLRVTRTAPAVSPDVEWTGAAIEETRLALGPGAHPRMESELILSRRSLLQAYLEEHEQYEVQAPGSSPDAATHYGLGIVVGLEASDPLRERVRDRLVTGRLPAASDGPIQVAMGLTGFRSFITDGEFANLSAWPPRATELAPFRFEATAGYVDESGALKGLVRQPVIVVGLFETGLDALDSLTTVADIAGVVRLTGETEPRANVFTVSGSDNAASATAAAHTNGWRTESTQAFSDRYLGQLLATVRAMSVFSVSLFLAVPAFLLWHGLQQLLDRQRREVAVCRAIGIGRTDLDGALRRLVLRVAGWGVLAAVLLSALFQWVLPGLLAGSNLLPLPMGFVLDAGIVVLAGLLVVASTGVSLVLAQRRSHSESIPAALRAP